ncbi:MAG: hypothetical protein KDI30_10550 [Pseudomonadales bacterium]|nr:hypothetical protein [Pseudomonadales bacterium]
MKRILQYIQDKNNAFGNLPIFDYLQDDSIAAEKRLIFAPYMAHFVFSFMDINRFVLRDLSSDGEFQDMVNIHTHEDANHWPWYLEDIKRLGFERNMSFGAFLRFLWSDHSIKSRMITYEMVALIRKASSIEKVIIVEVVEMTGNVFLSRTRDVCLSLDEPEAYLYYGQNHLNCESGHHMGTRQVEKKLRSIELGEQQYFKGKVLVDEVYKLYHDFADEMFEFVNHRDEISMDQFCYESSIKVDV